MYRDRWIIECRTPAGALDFTAPQHETIFGAGCITGLTEDQIAKTVFRLQPDAVMRGDAIATWPALVDPRFIARRKTW